MASRRGYLTAPVRVRSWLASRAGPGTCPISAPDGNWPGEDRAPAAVLRSDRQRCDHGVDARRLGLRPGAPADQRVPVDRGGRQPVRGPHPGLDEGAEKEAAA
jgi:hypothetical protein